jgi:Phosphotransferase enzyme family
MARPCLPIWRGGRGGWSGTPRRWPGCIANCMPSRRLLSCRRRWARGGGLVHLDLHPGNVVLTASGPMVIDWPNAARGDGLADVAYTWVILTTSRPEASLLHRLILATGRRLLAVASHRPPA